MKDLYLRFADESEAHAVLTPFGLAYVGGSEALLFTTRQGGIDLDVIGEIPGRSGFHANLRVMDDDMDVSSLDPYVVNPANPVRVWA